MALHVGAKGGAAEARAGSPARAPWAAVHWTTKALLPAARVHTERACWWILWGPGEGGTEDTALLSPVEPTLPRQAAAV